MSHGKHSFKVNNITLSILLSLSCISSAAVAGEWNGSASDNWFEASNWSPAATPDASTTATINNGTVSLKNNHSTITNLKIAPGNGHSAQLTLSDGGQLIVTGSQHIIALGGADGTNGSGKLFVTGGNSKFTLISDSLYVGQYGQGELQVSGGGKVYLEGTNRGMVLADHKSAAGIVGVDGQGSLIDIQGNLTVGGDGNGYLNITNGGTVNTHSSYDGYSLLIGGFNGDNTVGGYVLVDGDGSSLNIGGDMYIGNTSSGILTISDGAKVNVLDSANSYLADKKNDVENSVLVTGLGSVWNAGNLLLIGRSNSSGTLTINSGGEVTAAQGIGVGYGDYSASTPGDGINVINIGGVKGSAAQAAGYLNTPYIELFSADKSILNLNHTDNSGTYSLGSEIGGSGTINQLAGTTILTGNSRAFSGKTEVSGGRLIVNGELGGQVNIGESGTLGGGGAVYGNVENSGLLAPGAVPPQALDNAVSSVFTTLTINGNYISHGGTLLLNTQLSGDQSPTDKLIVNGNTSGLTTLLINAISGAGNETQEGIQVVQVNGISDGAFVLEGRAVAGAYEYFLYQGGVSTPDDGDWYLRSALNSDNPEPSVYRPEAGGYMANMAAANRLFTLRLADREGRAENSSMWLRQVGSRLKHRDNSGQLHTSTNSYVIQGGGELFGADTSDTGHAGLGVMLGYGYAKSKSESQKTGYRGDSSVKGYSAGVYGTWYQDAKTLDGAYVDSWMQYSWLDAEVSGQLAAGESYDMDGFSASLEVGYRLPVYESANGSVYLTPQGQVIWSGITADTVREANGTRVTSSGDNNVQTRLGLKVSRDGVSDVDKGKDKLFTVYAEANWLYNSKQAGATMDGVTVSQAGSRNVGELKLGAEGQLNRRLNLWTNVGQQLGGKGFSDTVVMLGIKYRF